MCQGPQIKGDWGLFPVPGSSIESGLTKEAENSISSSLDLEPGTALEQGLEFFCFLGGGGGGGERLFRTLSTAPVRKAPLSKRWF